MLLPATDDREATYYHYHLAFLSVAAQVNTALLAVLQSACSLAVLRVIIIINLTQPTMIKMTLATPRGASLRCGPLNSSE